MLNVGPPKSGRFICCTDIYLDRSNLYIWMLVVFRVTPQRQFSTSLVIFLYFWLLHTYLHMRRTRDEVPFLWENYSKQVESTCLYLLSKDISIIFSIAWYMGSKHIVIWFHDQTVSKY